MTLPPEKIGDKGRRYEIWCDTEDGPMCVGWSDAPGAFKKAVELHPSHHNWREIDRHATRERVEELEQEIERLRADKQDADEYIERLEKAIYRVIHEQWSVTELQELIGEI